MSNRSPFEEYINKIRAVSASSRGGFPSGGGGRPPRGLGAGLAGLFLVGGGIMLVQNALFNVDGGHRAIKYRRISGVSKDIYSEGATLPASGASFQLTRGQEPT
jgi:prohibitin 2